MFVTCYAFSNFSVIFVWIFVFCFASAKQSSEIYCGGNVYQYFWHYTSLWPVISGLVVLLSGFIIITSLYSFVRLAVVFK